MDRTDIEILTALKSAIPMDLNGVKMSGMNMPDTFEIENRLSQLQDQQLIKKTDEKLYRITHNGKNLFWKENDEENNIMRLLKASRLTNVEMKRITGLTDEKFKAIITPLILKQLVFPQQKTEQGFPYELSQKGHERIKLISEQPTHITQNFITNIDKVQINNSITIIQTKIEQLIIQVENDSNLKPDEKLNIISKLNSLKELFSTAEPYIKPYLIKFIADLSNNWNGN